MNLNEILAADAEKRDREDDLADVIAALTPQEAESLWTVIVQMKPHLSD